MHITASYPGGNIRVLSVEEDVVYLTPDLRDTQETWFYWSFRVEGAQGRRILFSFCDQNCVSYWGPAVSYDNRNWHWQWDGSYTSYDVDEDGTWFAYTFGPEEDCVYFCHDMNYQPMRFAEFADEKGLEVSELCRSKAGASVPMVTMGNEGPMVLLVARHHCCESTGSYLLEGILREFIREAPRGFRVVAVPFMDYDGAVAGDQGKGRAPHDHNRDYIDEPIWQSTAAIMDFVREEKVCIALDLHSPWHRGREHDHCFVLRGEVNDKPGREVFCRMLANETRIHPESFPFWYDFVMRNYPSSEQCFAGYFARQDNCELVMTIETTYAGHFGCRVTEENLLALGACIGRVIRTMYGRP